MAEIVAEPVTRRQPGRRRVALVAGVLAVVTALGGGAIAIASSGGHAVSRDQNGGVGIDGSLLTPDYLGQRVPYSQIQNLQEKNLAMISVNNRELACQGISLYFDTQNQEDSYQAGYQSREAVRTAERGGPRPSVVPAGTDPCAEFADAPKF